MAICSSIVKLGEDMATAKLAKAVTGNATGLDIVLGGSPARAYQASIRGASGTVSCTVTVQGTNEPPKSATSQWVTINAFSLSGSVINSQVHTSVIPWNAVRVITASMTGTAASVDVTVSY